MRQRAAAADKAEASLARALQRGPSKPKEAKPQNKDERFQNSEAAEQICDTGGHRRGETRLVTGPAITHVDSP